MTSSDDCTREEIRVAARDGHPLCVVRVRGRAETPKAAALLVHGFGQNRHLWDMRRRSFAAYLAGHGYDVYVVELRGHGASRVRGGPYARRMLDYAQLDVAPIVDRLLGDAPRGELFLLGHSMGGVICWCLPRDVLSRVRGVVTIASPAAFAQGSPALRALGVGGSLLVRAAGAGHVRAPRAFATYEVARLLLRVLPLADGLRLPLFPHIWRPRSIERDILRAWLAVGYDIEGMGVFLEFVRWAGKKGSDGLGLGSHLRRYPAPILFVAAGADCLVPTDSVRPGYELVAAAPKQLLEFPGFGHVDILLGRRAPREVWPRLVEWLEMHRR